MWAVFLDFMYVNGCRKTCALYLLFYCVLYGTDTMKMNDAPFTDM
jgi:hypothetical protein